MTRYPGLIAGLGVYPRPSMKQVKSHINTYPEEIRETAERQFSRNYDLLVRIHSANQEYSRSFDDLMHSYSAATSAAFGKLLQEPEALTLLASHLSLTVAIGDLYKKDPVLVTSYFESLSNRLASSAAKESEEWERSLDTDPMAKQQYEEATREYAKEHSQPTVVIVNNYAPYTPVYAYSWWFGYPTWYASGYWRPYPYWYNSYYTGMPYGPTVIRHRMPCRYFFTWYWQRHQHHYNYAGFSNHCYRYYYGHRHAIAYNPVCQQVYQWRVANPSLVTNAWDQQDSKRTEMFREYGKMETERAAYNNDHPQRVVDSREFLDMNNQKFPEMSNASAKQAENKPVRMEAASVNNPMSERQVALPVREDATEGTHVSSPPDRTMDKNAISVPGEAVQPVYSNPVRHGTESKPKAEPEERAITREQAAPVQQPATYERVEKEYTREPERQRYEVPARKYEPVQRQTYEAPAHQQTRTYEAPARRYESPVQQTAPVRHYEAPAQAPVQRQMSQPVQSPREAQPAGNAPNRVAVPQ